jgi:hypothetical protein
VPVVLIAEMLLLVAVDDKEHVPAGSDTFIKVGLAGAAGRAAINGQLTVGDDGTVRTGNTRPGDELLADVYDAVRDHLEGKKARQVIGGLSRHIGGSRDRVVRRITEAILYLDRTGSAWRYLPADFLSVTPLADGVRVLRRLAR